MGLEAPVLPVPLIRDVSILGPGGFLPLRIYEPEGQGRFPVVVYLHGAGWVAGNLETHDPVCRYLCNWAPCVVVAVDYRLAPEHKFPAAVEDAYAVTVWTQENVIPWKGDQRRLAVAGDSAGGNLAAAVCLKVKETKEAFIRFQLLVNPALDMKAYDAEGFEELRWFRNQYLRCDTDHGHPYASPLLAPDLRGLPPAFILTSEWDVLRREAEQYTVRLREAGVAVHCHCLTARGHLGASYARASKEAQEALDLSVAALRAALASPAP